MELDKAIQNRHSVRKFSNKKPDWRTIIECIDVARFAPMAGNNYTLKFILVDDEEKIRKIAEASQQRHVGEVKFILVACSKPSRTLNEYGKDGEKFVRQQAGAAIQNFLLKIEESGLATCWVGYFAEEQIKRELKIPDEVNIEAIFPIGYERERKRTRKMKIDIDRILYFNSYDNSKMKNPKIVD
jgi:nitroreductase